MADVARIGDVAFLVSSDRKAWVMIELKAGGYAALHSGVRVLHDVWSMSALLEN